MNRIKLNLFVLNNQIMINCITSWISILFKFGGCNPRHDKIIRRKLNS